MKVEQLMTRDVKVCAESDTLNRAAELMWNSDCGCVPVISINGEGKVVGVITDRDIAMAALEMHRNNTDSVRFNYGARSIRTLGRLSNSRAL